MLPQREEEPSPEDQSTEESTSLNGIINHDKNNEEDMIVTGTFSGDLSSSAFSSR